LTQWKRRLRVDPYFQYFTLIILAILLTPE
jgi:hypothetical protein